MGPRSSQCPAAQAATATTTDRGIPYEPRCSLTARVARLPSSAGWMDRPRRRTPSQTLVTVLGGMSEPVSTARRQLTGKPYAEIAAETPLCSVGTRRHVSSTFPKSSAESRRLSGRKSTQAAAGVMHLSPYPTPRARSAQCRKGKAHFSHQEFSGGKRCQRTGAYAAPHLKRSAQALPKKPAVASRTPRCSCGSLCDPARRRTEPSGED